VQNSNNKRRTIKAEAQPANEEVSHCYSVFANDACRRNSNSQQS